jgi:signal transduction histidine kinase
MFEDNGTGFDADKATKGYGLKNIRSRAELYGGEFYTDTAPGKGFRCEVILQPPT